MNRGDLKAACLDALNRRDLDGAAELWITGTTRRINTELRHRDMLRHRVLAVTSNVTPAPDDFIEVETLKVNRDGGSGPIVPGQAGGGLLYAPPDRIAQMAAEQSPGIYSPGFYTTHGKQIELAPWRGDTSWQLDLWYYAKIILAPVPTATNWFLEEYPHVYLNGLMTFGHRFLLEPEAALGYEALFGSEITMINDSEKMAKHGNGPLIVAPKRRLGGRFS